MGLYKRGKIWWINHTDPDGKPVRFSTGVKSRKDADLIWSSVVVAKKTGTYVKDSERSTLVPVPWEIAIESYLQDRDARGKRADSYKRMADWLDAFRGMDVRAVGLNMIEDKLSEWRSARRWSPATYNNALAQVSGLFSYAYRKGWVNPHPLKGRAERMTVNNARQRWLRLVEVEAIREAAVEVARRRTPSDPAVWLANLVDAAAQTGLRRGRLCDLRCRDVEKDESGTLWLYIGKDKNGDPIHKRLLGRLRAAALARITSALPGAYLFPGPGQGNPNSGATKYLPLVVRYASLRTPGMSLRWGRQHDDGITFHTFRHSMASIAANSGVPLDVVQKMGNWKTNSMMRRYAHLADERLQDGEEKLAALFTMSHSGESNEKDEEKQTGVSH